MTGLNCEMRPAFFALIRARVSRVNVARTASSRHLGERVHGHLRRDEVSSLPRNRGEIFPALSTLADAAK